MKAIRAAVSVAGIAAMVAVVASGQVALVAADGDLETVTGVRAAGHAGEIFENDHHRH